MPDIKYVCLSDMHLGAENSLLSNLTLDCSDTDPRVPSPILSQLVECLKTLISQNETPGKPVLILNGDILELALTTDNEAAMVFERFIELIFPEQGERLFEKILYIPGNHDHHLWETAREAQYIHFITHNDSQKQPGSLLKTPWHTTKLFEPDYVPALFLEGIVHRFPHLTQEKIHTVYPNYALMSKDSDRCVIFSHGHFIESMYMLLSELRCIMFPQQEKPCSIYAIESQNFAWIDFFWSTMGRSGEVGVDVERVYDALQSEAAMKKIVANIAEGLAERYDLPGLGEWAEKRIIKGMLDFLLFKVAKVERAEPEVLLSESARQGLANYIQGPVFEQMTQERDANIPPRMTFVFGHTHKPFEEDMDLEGYHPGMSVYNSGGWVVDTTDCQPLHGGAVILLDENLDSTSLRMYNESKNEQDYAVKVAASTHPNAPPNPFHERIAGLVDPAKNPWKVFSELVYKGVPMRYENLKKHIAEE
ncbi:MAG: hypothetical protein H7Y30_00925 [Pyrinomonadaceae bacterium]|nr:hypothetical protein [Pyrinomonadaceae bacterium]